MNDVAFIVQIRQGQEQLSCNLPHKVGRQHAIPPTMRERPQVFGQGIRQQTKMFPEWSSVVEMVQKLDDVRTSGMIWRAVADAFEILKLVKLRSITGDA